MANRYYTYSQFQNNLGKGSGQKKNEIQTLLMIFLLVLLMNENIQAGVSKETSGVIRY